jgi:hypothetical protein
MFSPTLTMFEFPYKIVFIFVFVIYILYASRLFSYLYWYMIADVLNLHSAASFVMAQIL